MLRKWDFFLSLRVLFSLLKGLRADSVTRFIIAFNEGLAGESTALHVLCTLYHWYKYHCLTGEKTLGKKGSLRTE